jgi:hypothetical protein
MPFPFSDYLLPSEVLPADVCGDGLCLGHNIRIWDASGAQDLTADTTMAIVGIPDDRGSNVKGEAPAVDLIRKELYRLADSKLSRHIIDLGNIRRGKSLKDTYCGLREVIEYLRGAQITVLLIGGSSDLAHTAIPKLPKG